MKCRFGPEFSEYNMLLSGLILERTSFDKMLVQQSDTIAVRSSYDLSLFVIRITGTFF